MVITDRRALIVTGGLVAPVIQDLFVRIALDKPVLDLKKACFEATGAVAKAPDALVPLRDQIVPLGECVRVVHAEAYPLRFGWFFRHTRAYPAIGPRSWSRLHLQHDGFEAIETGTQLVVLCLEGLDLLVVLVLEFLHGIDDHRLEPAGGEDECAVG